MRDADHFPHSFGLRARCKMTQQPSNKVSGFIFVHSQVNQAISPVAQRSAIEIGITGKERRPSQTQEQWNDLVVRHSLPADVETDLADRNPPML
jgi:hypothetical protein